MVQGVPGWCEDELEARDGDALLRVTQQAGGKARARARADPARAVILYCLKHYIRLLSPPLTSPESRLFWARAVCPLCASSRGA